MTEARFLLGPVNESTAGDYYCLYYKESIWSPRSENLVLKVTREDVTQAPDPGSTVNSVSTSQSYKVWIGVRMAVAGVVFLVLVAILGEAWHNQEESTDSSGSMNLWGNNQWQRLIWAAKKTKDSYCPMRYMDTDSVAREYSPIHNRERKQNITFSLQHQFSVQRTWFNMLFHSAESSYTPFLSLSCLLVGTCSIP